MKPHISDITYGWNGGMAGYSLYHYHFTNIIEDHSKSILLTPSLTPIINLQNVETIFKGTPFTKCKVTPYTNDYNYLLSQGSHQEPIYTANGIINKKNVTRNLNGARTGSKVEKDSRLTLGLNGVNWRKNASRTKNGVQNGNQKSWINYSDRKWGSKISAKNGDPKLVPKMRYKKWWFKMG